jgi:hypothetical protein
VAVIIYSLSALASALLTVSRHDPRNGPIIDAGISSLAPVHFYGARTSPRSRILILDNHDFCGHTSQRIPAPKFHVQHGLHRRVLRPQNIWRGTLTVGTRQMPFTQLPAMAPLSAREKNRKPVSCKNFIYMVHF